ncbi:MAG: phage tail tube protein [Pseudomonadota bacterium]
MSEGIIAYGATMERSTDGSTWSSIPEVNGIGVPVVTTEYPEVTSLDSPNGFREYIKGLKDAGEVTASMVYTAAGYALMSSDQNAADSIYYRVTMKLQPGQSTTGDVFQFRAFPTPELEASDVGAVVGINLQLRLTGDVTWTQGS